MKLHKSIYWLILVCLVSSLFFVSREKSSQSIFRQVSSSFQKTLLAQEADVRQFEDELSVYSNPFSISDDGTFTKRVFLNGGLIYWNNDDFVPSYSELKQPDTLYTISDRTGVRIVKRHQVFTDNDLIEIFSIVTLSQHPQVTNEYLSEKFNPIIFERYKVDIEKPGNYALSFKDKVLVTLRIDRQTTYEREIFGAILLFLAIVLTIFLISKSVQASRFARFKVLIIISSIAFFRFIFYIYVEKFVSKWELFDPVYFTSGLVSDSIGGLVITSLCLLSIVFLLYQWGVQRKSFAGPKSETTKNLFVLVIYLVLGIVTILTYQSVWLLLDNSQVDLDVSDSLTFDQIRLAAYSFILLLGLIYLTVFSGLQILLKSLSVSVLRKLMLLILSAIILFTVFGSSTANYLYTVLLVAFFIDLIGLNDVILKFKYESFVYIISVLALYALTISLGVYKHSEKDDLIAKEKFANTLLIRNDILGEYYLNKIVDDISQDRYVRSRLLSKVLARQNIREKIKRQFMSSYFKKYDIEVFLFDENGVSLRTDGKVPPVDSLRSQYIKNSYKTNYDNIYFIEDRNENVRNKYVSFIDIAAYGRTVGHIVLDLTLKKYIPRSVFPELLLESKYYLGSKREFDYAIYANGELKYKQGRHAFEKELSTENLEDDDLYQKGLEKGGANYYGLKTSDGRTLVISSNTYSVQQVLANSGFIFLILVSFSGLLFLIFRITSADGHLNLSTKIQIYLGLSFLMPMVLVSIALINTLNSSYKDEIERSFVKRSYNIAENILEATEAYIQNATNIDEYANEIVKASAMVLSDLNVYDNSGNLITTSQPEIFRLELLSQLLDPVALQEIKNRKAQSIVTDKEIGSLEFKVSYTALRSYKDGNLLGVLAMPYFDSKNHLRRQQIEVFSNLIVIFSLIFIISLIGGNFIVGQLVGPLKKIGSRIRSMSLQETNEPIIYDSNDEIGSLVHEYNAMLVKLEQSKEALAASQKESAWKEIARQVAHEIKNPLTPMRLKIQQMMRGFEPNTRERETCDLLINQIDSLSSIADSFSEFAKMPAPQNENIDVIELLNRTINLYQTNEVTIIKEYKVTHVKVFIDPKVFSRVLTNLLLNAIQADERPSPQILVNVVIKGKKVVISIADSGNGIPAEKQDQIFTPYFSTKAEGSGIGLALAKKGIENAGGNIWFESKEGKGTTFFVSLPISQI